MSTSFSPIEITYLRIPCISFQNYHLRSLLPVAMQKPRRLLFQIFQRGRFIKNILELFHIFKSTSFESEGIYKYRVIQLNVNRDYIQTEDSCVEAVTDVLCLTSRLVNIEVVNSFELTLVIRNVLLKTIQKNDYIFKMFPCYVDNPKIQNLSIFFLPANLKDVVYSRFGFLNSDSYKVQ